MRQDETKLIETGSRQHKIVLSCLVAIVYTPPTQTRQDSFVLSVSACEVAILYFVIFDKGQ